MNFKIRVVENIGEDSIENFGVPGTEINVVGGEFKDLLNYHWCKDGKCFQNIQEVNEYFNQDDGATWFNTVFELVEEKSNDKE